MFCVSGEHDIEEYVFLCFPLLVRMYYEFGPVTSSPLFRITFCSGEHMIRKILFFFMSQQRTFDRKTCRMFSAIGMNVLQV